MKPVAWIKVRELLYMQAVHERGATEWRTNLGLVPEPDDEGLYTETQVQELKRSFEQSVTDPENQPSQYGTVLMKDWVGLTDEEVNDVVSSLTVTDEGTIRFSANLRDYARAIEAKLKEKNTLDTLDTMKQALEALEAALSDDLPYIDKSKVAITALRQALEQQPADEPVAWVDAKEEGYEFYGISYPPVGKHHLYAAPVSAKAIRAEALEEAAEWCEAKQSYSAMHANTEFAAGIRGLK